MYDSVALSLSLSSRAPAIHVPKCFLMARVVEQRSTLPLTTVVEVRVRRGPAADASVLATVDVSPF